MHTKTCACCNPSCQQTGDEDRNERLWASQFDRWWGWNWSRKRDEQIRLQLCGEAPNPDLSAHKQTVAKSKPSAAEPIAEPISKTPRKPCCTTIRAKVGKCMPNHRRLSAEERGQFRTLLATPCVSYEYINFNPFAAHRKATSQKQSLTCCCHAKHCVSASSSVTSSSSSTSNGSCSCCKCSRRSHRNSKEETCNAEEQYALYDQQEDVEAATSCNFRTCTNTECQTLLNMTDRSIAQTQTALKHTLDRTVSAQGGDLFLRQSAAEVALEEENRPSKRCKCCRCRRKRRRKKVCKCGGGNNGAALRECHFREMMAHQTTNAIGKTRGKICRCADDVAAVNNRNNNDDNVVVVKGPTKCASRSVTFRNFLCNTPFRIPQKQQQQTSEKPIRAISPEQTREQTKPVQDETKQKAEQEIRVQTQPRNNSVEPTVTYKKVETKLERAPTPTQSQNQTKPKLQRSPTQTQSQTKSNLQRAPTPTQNQSQTKPNLQRAAPTPTPTPTQSQTKPIPKPKPEERQIQTTAVETTEIHEVSPKPPCCKCQHPTYSIIRTILDRDSDEDFNNSCMLKKDRDESYTDYVKRFGTLYDQEHDSMMHSILRTLSEHRKRREDNIRRAFPDDDAQGTSESGGSWSGEQRNKRGGKRRGSPRNCDSTALDDVIWTLKDNYTYVGELLKESRSTISSLSNTVVNPDVSLSEDSLRSGQ